MNLGRIIKSLSHGTLPPPREVPERVLELAASVISARAKISRLTSIERVFSSLLHKEPDHVPVTSLVCSAARQIKNIAFKDLSLNGEVAAEVFSSGFEFIGGDMVVLMMDLSVEAADFGQCMIFPDNSTAHPDYANPVIRGVDDYGRLRPIGLKDASRMQEFLKLCRIMVNRVGLRGLVTGFVFGPLGVLGMMRGAGNLLKDCMLYPSEVRKACETVTGVLIEYVEAQSETGITAIAIDALYAGTNGLPKKTWESIEGPFVKEISKAIKKRKLMVGVHNCGHNPFVGVQIKWMEPDVFSIAHLPDDCHTDLDLKKKYGEAVTILGYIPTPLLIHGTPHQVMDECRRQIDILAKGGGYILAPGCEYPPNIPLTNAFAMIHAARHFG